MVVCWSSHVKLLGSRHAVSKEGFSLSWGCGQGHMMESGAQGRKGDGEWRLGTNLFMALSPSASSVFPCCLFVSSLILQLGR